MARKRMLDPAIWNDKETIRLSPEGFILFIGLISQADDEGIIEIDAESLHWRLGRKELSEERIKELFPEIRERGLVEIYGDYAFLPNWFKHQALNRPTETKLRRPPEQLVKKYPHYIAGWERSFSIASEQRPYPFNTFQAQLNESSMSDHGELKKDSFPMEGKGKEEKGKEGNISLREKNSPFFPLAKFLFQIQLDIDENFKPKKKSQNQEDLLWDWANDFRLLVEIDKRAPPIVKDVLTWLKNGSGKEQAFWRRTVSSASGFRRNFPTMYRQYKEIAEKEIAELEEEGYVVEDDDTEFREEAES